MKKSYKKIINFLENEFNCIPRSISIINKKLENLEGDISYSLFFPFVFDEDQEYEESFIIDFFLKAIKKGDYFKIIYYTNNYE